MPEERAEKHGAHDTAGHGRHTGVAKLRGGQHEPRHRHIGPGGTGSSVGPVEQHRAVRREDDVERMQIEVDDARIAAQKALEPPGRGDLVQSFVQSRQSRGISTQRPRPPEEHVEHRGPVDALHDQLRAAGADVLDPRRGKAARGDVLHDLGLALHGVPETGAAHDEPGTVREDVRVAARREERTELRHCV